MTRWTAILLLATILASTVALGQTNPKHTYVNGYYRKDGTYVQGHYKTTSNSTNRDNFSTKGNINPYTGKPGWIQPDNNSTYSTYPSSTNSTYPSGNSNYNYSGGYTSSPKYSGTTNSSGQKVINYSNGQEVFGLCNYCFDVIYKETLDYYWYTPYSGIQKTQGGSGGTLLDGEYMFYNETGKLLIKANYKKGVEHGDYIIWDESGDIKEKMHYTEGVLDYAKFTNDDGYIIEWKGEIFKIGSVKNVYTKYGTLIETATVLEDFKFQYKLFYEFGGQLESEFTKGIGEYYYGSYKTYYQNGNPKVIGQFTDNFQDGVWKYFDEDSSYTTTTYRIYTEKYPNGKLKVKGGQYYSSIKQDWIKHGKWIYFKENGEDWADVKQFKNGMEVPTKK
ncbi:MAG: hypothetical protein AB1458_12275 [Bacteroidota bacterium]